jgi:hypothetical protein
VTTSAYRDAPPVAPVVVELGPVNRPSTRVLVLALAFGLVPGAVAASALRSFFARPDRSTLECTRTADALRCDALEWSKVGDAWRSRKVGVHVGRMSTLRLVHLGGHRPKDCLQFEGSLPCGGAASRHVETLRSLRDGESAQLDTTSSEGFSMIAGFGALFGLLAFAWFSVLRVLLQRRTRARVSVHPRYLEVETRWANLVRGRPRTLARVDGETARIVVTRRGGRGSLPGWRLEYGAMEDFRPLFSVAAIVKPSALEDAAGRTRAALEAVARTP